MDVEVEEAVQGEKAKQRDGKAAEEKKDKKETGAGSREAQKNPLEHATSLPEPFRGTNASRKLHARLRGEQEKRTGGGVVSPQRVLQRHGSNHVSPRPVMTIRRSSEVALLRANTSSSLGSGSAGSGRGRGALGHLKRKQGSEA